MFFIPPLRNITVVVIGVSIGFFAALELVDAQSRGRHPDVFGVSPDEAKLRVALALGRLAETARHLDSINDAMEKTRKGFGRHPLNLERLGPTRHDKEQEYEEHKARLDLELRRYSHLLNGFTVEPKWFEGQREEIARAYFALDVNKIESWQAGMEATLVATVFGQDRVAPSSLNSNADEQTDLLVEYIKTRAKDGNQDEGWASRKCMLCFALLACLLLCFIARAVVKTLQEIPEAEVGSSFDMTVTGNTSEEHRDDCERWILEYPFTRK